MQPGNALRIRWLDLIFALLVLGVLNGFGFRNSDDLSFMPWILRWDDAELFGNDLRFGEWPSGYYLFHIGYFVLLNKFVPIEWGLLLSSILSQLALLVALRRLAQRLAGTTVPATLFALLIAGYYNSHLVGGYHLLSSNFSTHYIAIAFVLLALDWFLDKRFRPACLILLPAAVMNPRIGGMGVLLLALVWFWQLDRAKKIRIGLASGILSLPFFVLVAVWSPSIATGDVEEVIRAWMYVRSPGHYAPAAWPAFVFLNFALVAAFLVAFWGLRPDLEARTVAFVALCCAGIVAAGILHNFFRAAPTFLVANPFQFGPFALAFCYVYMAVVLIQRFMDGRYFSSLPILIVPDLQMRLLLLLATIAADRWIPAKRARTSSGTTIWQELKIVSIQCATFLLTAMLFPVAWRHMTYAVQSTQLLLLAGVLVVGLTTALAIRIVSAQRFVFTVAAVFVAVPIGVHGVSRVHVRYEADNDTVHLCRYVQSNTSRDAVFIVPPGMVNFQADCRRAAFFVFAHLPLRLDRIPEWIARLRQLRLVPPDTDFAKLKGPVRVEYGDYPPDLGTADFAAIGERYREVSFVVTYPSRQLDLPVLFKNNAYTLYSLRPN